MSDDKIKFYNIEAVHLLDLKATAQELLIMAGARQPLNRDDLRAAAIKILTVVNFAETIEVFRTAPGEPYVHLNTKNES